MLFRSIFLCSYPFPIHSKSIFTAGASWKVAQGKTKFTLLKFVKSEEDDPLGPTPSDIYLLYYSLRGLFSCFLLLGRIIIKEWDFKPNIKAQVFGLHNNFFTNFLYVTISFTTILMNKNSSLHYLLYLIVKIIFAIVISI